MHKITHLFWLTAGLSLAVSVGCKDKPGTQAPKANKASAAHLSGKHVSSAVFKVTKMFCNGCVMNVTGQFKKMKGVLTAKVTLKPPRAHIKYNATQTTIPKLVATLKEGGYTATLLPAGTQTPKPTKDTSAKKKAKSPPSATAAPRTPVTRGTTSP